MSARVSGRAALLGLAQARPALRAPRRLSGPRGRAAAGSPVVPPVPLPGSDREIIVERRGPGGRPWWWRVKADEVVIATAPCGYRGAQEAYEAAESYLGLRRGRS